MKCVFFCCLLAFCAFETVISNKLLDKLNELHANTVQRINNITNLILAEIQNDVNAAKANGKDAQDCYESAEISLKTYIDPIILILDKCREEAADLKFILYAIKCNSGAVFLFKEDANTVRPSAQICIANN